MQYILEIPFLVFSSSSKIISHSVRELVSWNSQGKANHTSASEIQHITQASSYSLTTLCLTNPFSFEAQAMLLHRAFPLLLSYSHEFQIISYTSWYLNLDKVLLFISKWIIQPMFYFSKKVVGHPQRLTNDLGRTSSQKKVPVLFFPDSDAEFPQPGQTWAGSKKIAIISTQDSVY